MKKLEMNQMENLEGGKFWGWGPWRPMSDCINGKQTMIRDYYAFWLDVGNDYNVVDC